MDTLLLQTTRYYGHLRTGARSPAETTKKCMEITSAIGDSRFYGHFSWSQTNICIAVLLLLFVSRSTLKIGHFHKLKPDFSTMAIMKKQFCSNKIQRSDTKSITGSFSSHPAIADSRYYGHQMTVPRVSAKTRVD